MSRTLLVIGATGKQGGATVRALINSDFEILALTRDPTSTAAQKLANLSPNIKLLQGNLNSVAAIFEQARVLSRNSIWGIFSVQPTNKRDPSVEEVQGKNLIDAAVFNNVQLFVYTSVDRGGAHSATNPTNVPIWITKHRIEQYLRIKAKSSGMRYTILRPTSFMELLSDDLAGRIFATLWKNHFGNQRMHLVAVRDIGFFAAQAFFYSDRFMGVEMTLTGDELTFAEADAVFQDRFGRPLPIANGLLVSVFLRVSRSARTIFEFIKERPADLGIEQCRKIHPGLTDWKTWVGEESAFAKNARVV